MLLKLVCATLILQCHVTMCCKYSTFKNVSARVSVNRRNPQVILVNDCIKPAEVTQDITDITISNVRVSALLQEAVINLNNLKQLAIEKAAINTIEGGAFKNLSGLRYLNLRSNNLTQIKVGVFNDLPLTSLYLEHNQIKYIEDNALSISTLRILQLSDNHLGSFEATWFGASNLLQLYLDVNRIQEIPAKAFANLKNLIYLSLKNNSISNIHTGAFQSELKLKEIHLTYNRLLVLDAEAFEPLRNVLNNLYIGGNNLTYLPQTFFKNMAELKLLAIELNPWKCACYRKIRLAAEERHVHILAQVDTEGLYPVCVEALDQSQLCVEAVDEEVIREYLKNINYIKQLSDK